MVGALAVVFVVVGVMNRESKDTTGEDMLGDAAENLSDIGTADQGLEAMEDDIKEFAMTSFYEMKDGKPAPQFSLRKITVKKGDQVRIKVTNTKGVHDFTLDDYSVFEETPLDQEVTIEFTADKVGEFVYYCSKPGHRAAGQWGTFTVTE